jgi:hypothetical protein
MNQRQRSIILSTKLIYLKQREAEGDVTVPIGDMIRTLEIWLDETGFGPKQVRQIEGQMEFA